MLEGSESISGGLSLAYTSINELDFMRSIYQTPFKTNV